MTSLLACLAMLAAAPVAAADAPPLPSIMVWFPEWSREELQKSSPLQAAFESAFEAKGFPIVKNTVDYSKYTGDERLLEDTVFVSRAKGARIVIWGKAFSLPPDPGADKLPDGSRPSKNTLVVSFTLVWAQDMSPLFKETTTETAADPANLQAARDKIASRASELPGVLAERWTSGSPIPQPGVPGVLPPTKVIVWFSDLKNEVLTKSAAQPMFEAALKKKGFTIVKNTSSVPFGVAQVAEASAFARKAGADVVVVGEAEGPLKARPATVQLVMGWADRGSEGPLKTYKQPTPDTPAAVRKTLDALVADAAPRIAEQAAWDCANNRPKEPFWWLRVNLTAPKPTADTFADLAHSFGELLNESVDVVSEGVRVGGVAGTSAIYEYPILDDDDDREELLDEVISDLEGEEINGLECEITRDGETLRVAAPADEE